MSTRIERETIAVQAYDPEGLVASFAFDCLQSAQDDEASQALLQFFFSETLHDLTQGSAEGLLLWVIRNSTDARALANTLQDNRSSRCTRIVYLDRKCFGYAQALQESGAQIVVSQLPSLKRILSQIAPRLHRSPLGSHPLTSGLTLRLPWTELERDGT